MTAIRAEVPGIAVAFASIGFCHSVLVLLFGRFCGQRSEPWLKTQWRDGRNRKALAASALSFENLKRGQRRRECWPKSLKSSQEVIKIKFNNFADSEVAE